MQQLSKIKQLNKNTKIIKENIEGKIVVITGASSGMGVAAAKHLAALGATVVLGAKRADGIEKLAIEITDNGAKVLAVAADVTQLDEVKKLVDFPEPSVLFPI